MNADTKSFTCKTCGARIEYTYPIRYETLKDGAYCIIPLQKEHYKAVARFNHNLTHKGALDNFVR